MRTNLCCSSYFISIGPARPRHAHQALPPDTPGQTKSFTTTAATISAFNQSLCGPKTHSLLPLRAAVDSKNPHPLPSSKIDTVVAQIRVVRTSSLLLPCFFFFYACFGKLIGCCHLILYSAGVDSLIKISGPCFRLLSHGVSDHRPPSRLVMTTQHTKLTREIKRHGASEANLPVRK